MKNVPTQSARSVEVPIMSVYAGTGGSKPSATNARFHGWNVLPKFDLKSQTDIASIVQRQLISPVTPSKLIMNNNAIDPILKCKQICLHLNMTEEFESYKGIHPGKVIARLLDKRNISQRPFALALPEHPQTFKAILKGKRSLNTLLSLKIEKALGLEEGSLMTLQVHHDIKQERLRTQGPGPDLPKGLFWDVDIAKIDWEKHYKFVIKRIYERGDRDEQEVINQYYGEDKVNEVIAGRPITETGNLVFMPHAQR